MHKEGLPVQQIILILLFFFYSFVFLQLFYSPMFSDETERPITIPTSQVRLKSILEFWNVEMCL